MKSVHSASSVADSLKKFCLENVSFYSTHSEHNCKLPACDIKCKTVAVKAAPCFVFLEGSQFNCMVVLVCFLNQIKTTLLKPFPNVNDRTTDLMEIIQFAVEDLI